MQKIDYKKTLSEFYRPSARRISEVVLPAMDFLMIDGQGEPNTSQAFRDAVESLYPVSYTLKFMARDAGIDYGVLPLEGLWWADDMSEFVTRNKAAWKWTLMIMQPEPVSADMVDEAVAKVERKRHAPALSKLRFECFEEGRSAQILHIGPFDTEGPTVERLHRHIEAAGGRLRGKHHEIYLNDPRRTAPEKLRTVIRQPFE